MFDASWTVILVPLKAQRDNSGQRTWLAPTPVWCCRRSNFSFLCFSFSDWQKGKTVPICSVQNSEINTEKVTSDSLILASLYTIKESYLLKMSLKTNNKEAI